MVHPRARGERSINPVTGVIPDQVHPRARGERSSIGNGLSNIAGSSPRTRGTPRAFIASTASGRFIPAHAGNAGMSGSTPGGSSVHPRARGERTEGGGIMGKVYGSSPRTRGTPLCNMWLIGGSRFIPAHAGNATGWARRGRSWPVHPRARGERLTVPIFPEGRGGSSPRTRGTLIGWFAGVGRYRFIPAHAGNAVSSWSMAGFIPVHPRARGERVIRLERRVTTTGSSPRTRGTLAHITDNPNGKRFIPAHAGNAKDKQGRIFVASVHPRARGERSWAHSRRVRSLGSSPRTRGTRQAPTARR